MMSLLCLGMLAFGMGLALPAVTLNQLTDPKEKIHLDKSEASWFASVTTITCPLGSLLTAYVMDKIGRKRTFVLFNCIAIVSWALMASAVQDNPETVFIQLMISRCLIGVAMGMASSPGGVYGAEISLPKIRSRLILGSSLATASGVLAIYVLGYFIRSDWHLLAMVLLGLQITFVLLLIPVIETPSWLLSKGRHKEAKASLSYFRGLKTHETHDEVDAEFELLMKSINSGNQNERKKPFRKSLSLPEVYKPLLIMCGLFFFQQFSGIYVVVVYAVQIASEAGSSVDPILCAVLIGLARVLTTCLLGFILEKMGRRQAAMMSASGMAICMFLLGISKYLQIPYFAATVMIIYIVFSALGLWTLPFFIAAEVFPQSVRGPCSGVIGFFVYVMAFLILKAHPYLVDWMTHSNVLIFYAAMSLFAVFYVYIFLPETKGKTLQEIEEYFRTGKQGVRKDVMEVEMQETFVRTKA
ncbi:facilitated trehalose transporter Tret1-2 homolog isoform X2 [Episyrphus balteatus]|nr:facilitated trehalose transporter Tret1-2 homolog isoform X2 [Episyrphus balteatus]